MTLSIRPSTHTDPASIEAYCKVLSGAVGHDMPGFPLPTPRMAALWHEHPWVGRRQDNFIAYLDGEPVARLELEYPIYENRNTVGVQIDVLPEYRRRGIGRALWEKALEEARANGRTKVLAHTVWELPGIPAHDGGSGPAFAASLGLSSANLPEVMRRFDLSTLDRDNLDRMLEHARAKSTGYRLVRWNATTPGEYVADVAYLDSRLVEDAPMGDLQWEPEKVDVERIREHERSALARGRTLYHMGAVHEATNQLVAWTTLSKDAELPWHTWQQITIVEPRHRGHRLGALVKVENLLWFLKEEPDVKVIDTFNAHVNSYMIAINEQMGFRPLLAFNNWQRDI